MTENENEIDEIELEDRAKWITEREKQLQSVTMLSTEAGVKFVFVSNSGGSLAVLTYLGAIAQSNVDQTQFKISLATFFVGIILVGIYRVYVAEINGKLFWEFNALARSHLSDNTRWSEFVRDAHNQVMQKKIQFRGF